jgi:diguanylate cyclase (GGDEF)-like protein
MERHDDDFVARRVRDEYRFVILALLMTGIAWTLGSWTVDALGFEGVAAYVGDLVAYLFVGAPLMIAGSAIPFLRFQEKLDRESHRRQQLLREEARRQEFDSRLHRALELADDEPGSLDVVSRAFGLLSSEPVELLLADSSRAHLRPAAVHPAAGGPNCGVPSPDRCTAVRRGQTVAFRSGDDLDACPYLRQRETGDHCAACVPVTVLGATIGVLHTTGSAGASVPGPVVTSLESIANQAGARIGMIRALARSQVQAATDPLTGMLNRRSLAESVRPLLEAGEEYAVVMADLDRFKELNDTFGHEAGDRALRRFAEAVRRTLRPGDLASRHGGEEFLFVLPGCGAFEAAAAAERLRESIALATIDGTAPGFTASFGVADSSSLGRDFDALVRSADDALRTAKQSGRDRVVTAAGAGR